VIKLKKLKFFEEEEPEKVSWRGRERMAREGEKEREKKNWGQLALVFSKAIFLTCQQVRRQNFLTYHKF
jgi:hypothetical protein